MFSFTHLSDTLVRCGLEQSTEDVDTKVAIFIAYLAEFDERRLYETAGYDSMYAFCVGPLHRPEEAALKYIRAARTARRFPAIFPMLADGRLHLSAVVILTPYLTRANADGLLEAATHRSKTEIETLIAHRFPRTEEMALVEVVPQAVCAPDARQVAPLETSFSNESTEQPSPGTVMPSEAATSLAPSAQQPSIVVAQRVTPIAVDRVSFHYTAPRRLQEKYEHFRALRSHRDPNADMATTFEAALDIGIADLERRKYAAVERPRSVTHSASANPRHIPAGVKRAVRKRDGGQCTFVSDDGHRCASRTRLEFDHIEPVARGGASTVENLRLRCRTHNQFEAERTFGREFMEGKRRRAASE